MHENRLYHLGPWPAEVASKHINMKELLTTEVACAVNGPSWSGKSVLFGADSSAIVGVLNHGTSKNAQLMAIRRRIAAIAAYYSFTIHAMHIPGKLNKWADTLSHSLAQLLAPSSSLLSDLTPSGHSWLVQQRLVDSSLILSLCKQSPRIPFLSVAANQFIFSGAAVFHGTPHQRAYEDFVSAAGAGIRDLGKLAQALDRQRRAQRHFRRADGLHHLEGGREATHVHWHHTSAGIRGDICLGSTQCGQLPSSQELSRRPLSHAGSTGQSQEAASFSLDHRVGPTAQHALTHTQFQYGSFDDGLRGRAARQQAASSSLVGSQATCGR